MYSGKKERPALLRANPTNMKTEANEIHSPQRSERHPKGGKTYL